MSGQWRTLSPEELLQRAAAWIDTAHGVVRVAVDGPSIAEPAALADDLQPPLRALGRPVFHVRACMYWRDASLRYEQGKHDWESYLTWLDADALRREVLDAAPERHTLVASLRDPESNRSTREPPQDVPANSVVLVSGEFLLGRGLPFDRVIHMQTSAAARAREIPEPMAWTLPAYEAYDRDVRPGEQADVVIKSRRYPVVQGLP